MACRWKECMSTNILSLSFSFFLLFLFFLFFYFSRFIFLFLGVWLTSGLIWSKHINTIYNKAKQKIGILYRKYYQHASSASMLQVYLACIRPDLEYTAPKLRGYKNWLSKSAQNNGLQVTAHC